MATATDRALIASEAALGAVVAVFGEKVAERIHLSGYVLLGCFALLLLTHVSVRLFVELKRDRFLGTSAGRNATGAAIPTLVSALKSPLAAFPLSLLVALAVQTVSKILLTGKVVELGIFLYEQFDVDITIGWSWVAPLFVGLCGLAVVTPRVEPKAADLMGLGYGLGMSVGSLTLTTQRDFLSPLILPALATLMWVRVVRGGSRAWGWVVVVLLVLNIVGLYLLAPGPVSRRTVSGEFTFYSGKPQALYYGQKFQTPPRLNVYQIGITRTDDSVSIDIREQAVDHVVLYVQSRRYPVQISYRAEGEPAR